jgi:hypothetical protein
MGRFAEMTGSLQRWQVPRDADLRHREWDDEHVFFHGAAGDTHRLSPAAAVVLLELMAGPCDEARLAEALSEQGMCSLGEAKVALPEIMSELGRIECVERVP